MSLEIVQIIEDDVDQAFLLDLALRKARYRTNVAYDGAIGLEDARRLQPALVLLDLMLPGLDGHEVCRRLRKDPWTQSIPIIMVSALGSEDHRVAGLELGADDYIDKPFSPREVVSRVRAVLRRARLRAVLKEERLGAELVLEDSAFVVAFNGSRLQLSSPEWWILRRLAKQVGEMVTGEELMTLLWGECNPVREGQLDRYVQGLKRKIERHPGFPGAMVAARGVGYALKSFAQ